MTPTGIQFIEELRLQWSEGAITPDAALQKLLPWEDDVAARTQEELEAAWVLRQELEARVSNGDDGLRTTDDGRRTMDGATSGTTPIEGATHESGADARLQRTLANLRSNPLLSRDDLLAAHSECAHLLSAGETPDAEYVRTRCGEVEERVRLHVGTVQRAIEDSCQSLEDSPGMGDKLQACERIREGLADIELLHPSDLTLPDMIAWCEQTHHELESLLARSDLLISDIEGMSATQELDTGLAESCKQRLIVLSDMQLSKDDIELRKAARALSTRLTDYLSSKLQPNSTPGKGEVEEYARVLHLAKQAPEAIGAEEAKGYSELLASAQAALPAPEVGSEPPNRSLPSAPPPQPRSGTGSQPNAGAPMDGASQPSATTTTTPLTASNSNPATSAPVPVFDSVRPPPPPPRVQPGWDSTNTQAVTKSSAIIPHGQGTANVSPPPPRNTTSNPPTHPQPTQGYTSSGYRQSISPAVWVGIGVGAFLLLMAIIVTIVLLASKGGGTNNGGNGGNGAGNTARAFYVDLQRHDYQAAFDLLAPELAAGTDVNTIRGQMVVVENRDGVIQTVNVSNVTETGDTGQATVTVNYGKGGHSTEQFSLRKTGGRWLISGIT